MDLCQGNVVILQQHLPGHSRELVQLHLKAVLVLIQALVGMGVQPGPVTIALIKQKPVQRQMVRQGLFVILLVLSVVQ